MHPPLAFFIAYALLSCGVLLLITVAHFAVLFEARRRGLAAFGRWLVPSTLASVIFLLAWLMRGLGPHLGIRPASLFFLCVYALDAAAATLVAVALLRLRRMIQDWPMGAGGGHSPGRQTTGWQDEGVWPPPPTGPA